MKVSFTVGLTFSVLLQFGSSLHLPPLPPLEASQPVSLRDSDVEKSSNSSTIKSAGNSSSSSNNSDSEVNLKGNLNSITDQLQSSIQSLIHTLNNTLSSLSSNSSSGISSIFGAVKNVTISVINKGRLEEDVDNLVGNVSAILRGSSSDSNSSLTNSTSPFTPNKEVEGALRDFHESVLDFKRSLIFPSQNSSSQSIEKRVGENNVIPRQQAGEQASRSSNSSAKTGNKDDAVTGRGRRKDSLKKMFEQVDQTIQKSLQDARSRLEDTITNTARQGTQMMRNQTAGFMNEIRRVFSSFSEPIRQFLDDMRRKGPTAVVTA